jgi:hypothetical protein
LKLNTSYFGVIFEVDSFLKNFFIKEHLHPKNMGEVMAQPMLAAITGAYYDEKIGNDPWQQRVDISNRLVKSPPNMKKYFLTKNVLEGADLIKFDLEKVDLRMFKVLPDMNCLYITGKNEMYRFEKKDHRINVLYYTRRNVDTPTEGIFYESYSVILEDKEMHLCLLPSQNKEAAIKLLKLILFIEVGEISFHHLKPNGKIVYGKGGDDKVKNESGMDVTVVNSNWNKMIIIQGGFSVRGHFRMQWVGQGRTKLERVFVRPYEKGTQIRTAGRITSEKKDTDNQ